MEVNPDLQRIAEQERALILDAWDETFAWRLGSHLHELAAAAQLAVAIDVRRFGQPLFYSALPGSTPDNAHWVRRKSNVVAHFHRSSYHVGLSLDPKGPSLSEKYGLSVNDYAAYGGAFPLAVAGAGVIGSVTVSGLKQRDDHSLAVNALCDLLKRDRSSLAFANG